MNDLIKKLAAINISFILLIGCALAEVCEFNGQYDTSINQLVAEAEFIGRFKVLSAIKDEKSFYKRAESYQYRMVSQRDLKSGSSTSTITITGLAPENIPPQIYFTINNRHSKVRPETPTLFGISSIEKLAEGDICEIAPTFVIGYEYLILGGLNTRISYEPIHSPDDDAWYQMVKSAVAALEKTE